MNAPTRIAGCISNVSAARPADACSRFSRRSFRGGRRGHLRRRGLGQATRCACPVDSKTGILNASASSRTRRARVTSPNCAPRDIACLCKTFKSTCRNVTFSYFGQTSKMRGVFAHDIRSRTEMRSSCDSSVMICVFILPNYNRWRMCTHHLT